MSNFVEKIDKLSNYKLTLGLKNGFSFTAKNNELIVSGVITLPNALIKGVANPESEDNATNKWYVDTKLADAVKTLKDNITLKATGDSWITLEPTYDPTTTSFTIKAKHTEQVYGPDVVQEWDSKGQKKVINTLKFDSAGHIIELTEADKEIIPDKYWIFKAPNTLENPIQIVESTALEFKTDGYSPVRVVAGRNASEEPTVVFSHAKLGVEDTYGNANGTAQLQQYSVISALETDAYGHLLNITAETLSIPYDEYDELDTFTVKSEASQTLNVTLGVKPMLKHQATGDRVVNADRGSYTKDFTIPAASELTPGIVTNDTENEQVIAGPKCFTHNVRIGKSETEAADLIVNGNLVIRGTTTTVDSVNMSVADKNIIVAKDSEAPAASDTAGLVINMGSNLGYGIVYDAVEDAITLGYGAIDEGGNYIVDSATNPNFPIAVRDSSQLFFNNHVVKWDATAKKLVDGGVVVPVTAKWTDTVLVEGQGIKVLNGDYTVTGDATTDYVRTYTIKLAPPLEVVDYTMNVKSLEPTDDYDVAFAIDSLSFDVDGRLTTHTSKLIDLSGQVRALIPTLITSTDFRVENGALNIKNTGSDGLVKQDNMLTWNGTLYEGASRVASRTTTRKTVVAPVEEDDGISTLSIDEDAVNPEANADQYSIALVDTNPASPNKGQYSPAGVGGADLRVKISSGSWTGTDNYLPSEATIDNHLQAKLEEFIPKGTTQTIKINCEKVSKQTETVLPIGALIKQIVVVIKTPYDFSVSNAVQNVRITQGAVGSATPTVLATKDVDFMMNSADEVTTIRPYYTVTEEGPIQLAFEQAAIEGACSLIIDYVSSPIY